ncbi:hypothetical protein SK128_009369, partial [Halocaridina rubra]
MTEDGNPQEVKVTLISRGELKRALEKTKLGKTRGPDDILALVWKCLVEQWVDDTVGHTVQDLSARTNVRQLEEQPH